MYTHGFGFDDLELAVSLSSSGCFCLALLLTLDVLEIEIWGGFESEPSSWASMAAGSILAYQKKMQNAKTRLSLLVICAEAVESSAVTASHACVAQALKERKIKGQLDVAVIVEGATSAGLALACFSLVVGGHASLGTCARAEWRLCARSSTKLNADEGTCKGVESLGRTFGQDWMDLVRKCQILRSVLGIACICDLCSLCFESVSRIVRVFVLDILFSLQLTIATLSLDMH